MNNGMTMTNAVIECILSRSSAKYYDPAATLSDDQIRELVRIGTTAPTSFHLQNWRFIAVRTPEAKARLRPIAWDQPATTEAAVTFIVCGQLADSSVIPQRLAPLVEAGIMPAKMVPELGKVRKTIFLCEYLNSEALRQEIEEGLNVIENWNSANDFIWYGKGGEISTNNKEEQELAILALHLLQICLVYINTLLVQKVLQEKAWFARMQPEDFRGLTPLF